MGELENNDSEIVYNPDAVKSNKIAVENKPMQDDGPGEPESGIVFNPNAGHSKTIHDQKMEINLEDYTGYLGEDIYANDIDVLNKSRAINQSWYGQAGNMVGQAVVGEIIGGTVEAFGYLLDVQGMANIAKGEEKEWGNWLSDIGKSIREESQEAMPIYQINEGEFDMSDSGWWFSNGVSVASSLSMLIPSMAAVKGLTYLGKGMSKAAGVINKSLDVAGKMTKQAKWASNGISQAIVSRHIENSMEASGTFESYKAEKLGQIDPETGEKFTEERANQLASDAASSNYRAGWAMLMQDIPQYLALGKVFNPRTMKMESALKKAATAGKVGKMGKFGKTLKGGAIVFASEGAEESYQYYIAERGKLLSDLNAGLIDEEQYEKELRDRIGDEEMLTSAFWGGLGGNLFQAAGKGVGEAFKSKTQKANEANYAKMQGDFLKKRGESFKLMQAELAAADESGDPLRREAAINDMMLSMTIEAIELDKYDSHIESLTNTMSMSKEEQAAFAEKEGIELNQELFKQYAPKAIEASKRVKKTYENHLKRNSSSVAGHLTRNDIQVYEFEETIKKNRKEAESMKQEVPGADEMSQATRNITDNKSRITALKTANMVHKMNASKDSNKDSFNNKNRTKLIADNEAKIKEFEKDIELNKKELTSRSKKEKAADSRYGNGYTSAQDNILDKYISSAMLTDGIVSRQRENLELKKDSYQQELAFSQFKNIIGKRLVDQKSADQIREDIAAGNFTPEQKLALTEEVTKKLKVITDKAALDQAAAEKETERKRLEDELDVKESNNPEAIVDKGVTGNIENVLDDPYADEDVDLDGQNADRDDKVLDNKVKSSGAVGLLDQLSGTSGTDGYQEWSQNGESKIGQEINYELSFDYTGSDQNVLDAIAAYNNILLMRETPTLTQQFIDYLPIKAKVNNSAHTFLPTRTSSNPRFDELVMERTAILELLFANKEAKTNITHTSGGSIVQDSGDRSGKVPEYSVSDLQQIASNEDVEFMVTNEEGELVDMNKEYIKEFEQRMTVGDNTTDGTPMPYRGGIFMKVKKADGTTFPMKLSLNKNTPAQAELLADLLIKVAVSGKEGKSEIPFKTSLALLPEDLQARIKDVMGAEIDALMDNPESSPQIIDIINMFTYVSDKTSGQKSRLYMNKGSLNFGTNGSFISETTKDSSELKAELVEFLTNVKRRQFSLDLYNRFPKYHDFVIDNKVVSTNSTITEPLFQSDFSYVDGKPAGRRVQAYVKPIHTHEVKDPDAKISVEDIGPQETTGQSSENAVDTDKSRYTVELNEEIKAAFPNKDYWYLNETLVDGKYVVKTFKGITVPNKKLAELEAFKTEFYKSKGIEYVSEFSKVSPIVNDSDIRKEDNKDVSSQKNKKRGRGLRKSNDINTGITITKKSSEFDNLTPGKVNKKCE